MKLYRTASGSVLEQHGKYYALTATGDDRSWDALITREDLCSFLESGVTPAAETLAPTPEQVRAPLGTQEVWAAGVTYSRSREARRSESQHSAAAVFYEHVYEAERPELFFKATAGRVVGPNGKVAIRSDSSWSVPEPELTLLITPQANIVAYTIGNDMSSRSLEGENLLYLPQAKIWDRSCALGPCLLVAREPLPASTEITLQIQRDGDVVFRGSTELAQMKRDLNSLVSYLFRHNTFSAGCFLMTGTGIIPPDSFSLAVGDSISISISQIGTLTNLVG